MIKTKKIRKKIAVVLIFFFLFQTVYSTPPAMAMHGLNLEYAYVIGQVDPVPDPGNPEPEQSPNQNPPNECPKTDPIVLTTGEFTHTFTDAVIPSRGMPLEIKRTYRSRKNLNNRFGYGWYFNFFMRLQKLSSGNMLLINGETARKDEFVQSGLTYTSPDGVYETLVNNGDGTHTLTNPQGVQYIFDIDGKLTAKRDRYGNQITYEYDPVGKIPISGYTSYVSDGGPIFPDVEILLAYDYKLTKIIDTVGRSILFDYYPDGRVKTITDFAGRVWRYTYFRDDLIKVTSPATTQYPSGVFENYTYDKFHNLLTATNARGQIYLTNHYDASDRADSQTYCGGQVDLVYDPANKKTVVTDSMGFKTLWTYNSEGHISQREDYSSGLHIGDPTSFITQYTYNRHGEISTITFPKGNGIAYTYDENNPDPRSWGNLLSVRRKSNMTLPNNDTSDLLTQASYEPQFNQIKTLRDPKNNLYTYLYDYELPLGDPRYNNKGSIIAVYEPSVDGQIPATNIFYNSFGQITRIIDPNNNRVDYDYFSTTGYLQAIRQDPSLINAVWLFTYDAYGNIDTIVDANNHIVNLDFDALGHLEKETSPLGFQTKYFYDEDGHINRIERQADVFGTFWQVTKMTHDPIGKIQSITDPLNRTTTFSYDANQNLTSILDAEGKLTQYQYDERNGIFKVIDANVPSGVTQSDYDLNGNLAKLTDAKGQATNYTYDLFDRLTRTTYADNKFSDFVYDNNSNLITHITPSTKAINYIYDELNRLRQKNFPLAPSLNSTYAYDLGSRLTDANNAQANIHYSYDALNRVKNIRTTINSVIYNIDYGYFKSGLRQKIVYPSSKLVEYTYDNDNQMDSIKVNGVLAVDYDYDPLGRRQSKTLFTGSVQEQNTYAYDIADQLGSVTNKLLPSTLISQYSYPIYDKVGNRKQLKQTLATFNQTLNYEYNNLYELTNISGGLTSTFNYDSVANRTSVNGTTYTTNNLNQYTSVGDVSFGYDDNGNMTTDGTNTFTFDEENRLAKATKAGSSASYAYDAFNRRVSKTVNGVTTDFVYDADEVIGDYTPSGSLIAEYLYGSRLDEVVAMKKGSDNYFYHYDGLGSVTEITDASGAIAERYAYSQPYGNPSIINATDEIVGTSSIGNRYMFTGREYDAESGNYHYRSRIYNPTLGRFLQRDPIDYYDSMNLYQYVGNNPLNWVDPTGLQAVLEGYWVTVTVLVLVVVCNKAIYAPKDIRIWMPYHKSDDSKAGDDKTKKEPSEKKKDGRQRNNTPSKGEPNSKTDYSNSTGNTTRYYGPDGNATKDVDYGHDHTGVGDPHVHDWDWNKKPPRQGPRSPQPGET